jgi:hypothetical protein
MGYSFDYFVAALRCPVCGQVSPADESTNMQTKIRDQPELAYLGVGHPLHIRPEQMQQSGYLTVRWPQPGEAVRILETWECPSCGTTFNWAEIVVADGAIASITEAVLSRETLERIHFISDDAMYVAADLAGVPFTDIVGADAVQILRDRLVPTEAVSAAAD